jgi:Tol biopolymer transport system component/DNA-binding winged helix-turn-helix (wHTH) protein
MPQPDLVPTVVRFAHFEVDVRAGELRKHGRRVRLQEQPLRILSMLLEKPGEVITREELRLNLWPADTFVDFDHGLNSAVARLRESLCDSADTPRFVETIPRKGYRFVGEVEEVEPPSAPVPVVAEALPTKRSWRDSYGIWLVSTVVLAIVMLAFARLRGHSATARDIALPNPEFVPLAGLAGYEIGPAFSPDGNQVAFREINGRQNSGIYTSLVGGEQSLRLTHDRGDCCVTWSPDSREIAFLRRHPGGADLYTMPAIGGGEHRLFSTKGDQYPGLSWSPDGKLLAFPHIDSVGSSSSITLFELATSATRRLTHPPDEYLDRNPEFSPDGSRVAFIRGTVAGVANDVYVVQISGAEPRRLTFDSRPMSGVAWSSSGKDIIYSTSRGGAEGLWRVPATGGTPQPVFSAGLIAFSPTIARKGNQLAFQQGIGKDNIMRLSVRGGDALSARPTIAIPAKGKKLRPSFSPDGKRIAFESDRLGYLDIWICSSNGINCMQLTSLHGTAGTARWSPDGQTLAFEYHPGERAEIYTIDVAGGIPRKLPTLPGADNLAPYWSRDGRWVYFSSKRGGQPFQLWKIPAQGGHPVQVTKKGGIGCAESEDGRYLYFSKYESPGIWRMPLTGGQEEQVLREPDGTNWFNWALANKGIYFLNDNSEPRSTIDYYDFATRKTRHVHNLEKPWGWGLAVSPDNQSLLFVQNEFEQSNIVVVKNFR